MIKTSCLLLCVLLASAAIGAEQPDSCAGLEGSLLSQCRANQQTFRQQLLELQLQQQQERQNQLDKQQREMQQQMETMRLQNESLRQQLERETPSQAARPVATEYSKTADVKSWKADNPWFGSDFGRTQFAMRYIKQLQQERPDLGGRELLDALSAKVNETFGAKH